MPPIEIAGLTVFVIVLFFGIFSILFGFPGTIIIVTATVIFALLTGFTKIGIKIILILSCISLAAEFLDFYLGVKGATKFGASKKGIIASMIGALIGAVALTPFLLGLGTLIGVFAGGAVGAFVVEIIRQQRLKPAMRATYGALLGRVAGTIAKGCCALVMIVIVLSAIYS